MGNLALADATVVKGVSLGRVQVRNSAGKTAPVMVLAGHGSMTGAQRAVIVRDRLNSLFQAGANLGLLTPGMMNGEWVVQQVPWGTAQRNLVVTATAADATFAGDTRWHLTLVWANALRQAVDTPVICSGGSLALVDAGLHGVQPVVATLSRTNATYYSYETPYGLTASGECWHPYDNTCALWAMNPADTCSLGGNYVPFGTYLRVTNLNNQAQVVVRVVDRGPRKDIACNGTQMDLSRGAAEAIGFDFGAGHIPVRLEQLS